VIIVPGAVLAGFLDLAGRTHIAEATRWAARSTGRPFTILRLT
jgi:hypothetical protein